MNRREFLLGLLSVPFGWKALFRKEIEQDEEIDNYVEYAGADWAVSPNDLAGLGGDLAKMINTGREDVAGEIIASSSWFIVGEDSTGDQRMTPTHEFTSGYADIKWDFPLCEVKPEIHYGQCEEIMDDIRVDGITGPISNLADWGKESSFVYTNPSYGADWVPGQRVWAEDICRILTEIIEWDVPGMLLKGSYDIDWMPPEVYIRQDCGPSFWCKDIDVEKTVWYRRAEELSHYGETWELIT